MLARIESTARATGWRPENHSSKYRDANLIDSGGLALAK